MNILKKKKTTLSPDDEYLKWKNEHKDKRIPTYYISIFENEYYYAEASTYTHTQDDTITIKTKRIKNETRIWSKNGISGIKNLIAGILLGVPNYFSIIFLIKSLQTRGFESSMLFTINNVGIVVLSTIFGVVLFKEHFSLKNKIGIALAIFGIIMVAVS